MFDEEASIFTISDDSACRQQLGSSSSNRNFQYFEKHKNFSRDVANPVSIDDDEDKFDLESSERHSFFSSPYDQLRRSVSAGSPFPNKQSSNDSEKVAQSQSLDFRGKDEGGSVESNFSVFYEESPLRLKLFTSSDAEDRDLKSVAPDQVKIEEKKDDAVYENQMVHEPSCQHFDFPSPVSTAKPMPHPNTKSKMPPPPLNKQPLSPTSPALMSPASDVSDNEHEYFSDTNRSDVSDMTEGSRFSGVRYNTYERSTSQVRFSGGGIPMNAMATPPPMFYPNQFFPGSPPFLDPNSALSNHTSPDAQSIGQMPSFFGPHSPGLTAPSMFSITMYRDSEDALVLKNYLQDTVGCTEAFALQYSNILIKNGVPTIEVLRRRLLRNREFLLDIGFDEYTALDIVDILFPTDPTNPPRSYHQMENMTVSSNSLQEHRERDMRRGTSDIHSDISSLTSHSRGSQMFPPPLLPRNSTAADPRGGRSGYIGSGRSMMSGLSAYITDDDSLAEIASVYAKALNNIQDRENYQKLLTYVDEEDNPYAEGFLMRLLALGHGGLDKNISKATKYAIKLLPWMKDVIQETEMIPHNTSSMYCKYFLAQYNLALCYELGKGTPINLPLSLKYYQLAAEQDHAVAQYTIGMMYLNGYSSIVSANSELGFYWLQRSSNKGYSKAHTSLGTCYEKGIGVEQNYELAIYYYQLGVDHDDSAASSSTFSLCLHDDSDSLSPRLNEYCKNDTLQLVTALEFQNHKFNNDGINRIPMISLPS
eukprot:gene8095-8753_t